jgi:hypothetical protein
MALAVIVQGNFMFAKSGGLHYKSYIAARQEERGDAAPLKKWLAFVNPVKMDCFRTSDQCISEYISKTKPNNRHRR